MTIATPSPAVVQIHPGIPADCLNRTKFTCRALAVQLVDMYGSIATLRRNVLGQWVPCHALDVVIVL